MEWDWLGTIIAAVIAAVVAVWSTIYSKRKTETGNDTSVVVPPPPGDPLAGLKADSAGVKEIETQDVHSPEYVRSLATRLELVKTPGTEIEVNSEEG